MASYGVFVALCGFEYHGPRGTMAFAPRLTPENFRSAFTAAEGWGTYAQTQEDNGFRASLELKYGKLELNQLTFTLPKPRTGHTVAIMLDGALCRTKQASMTAVSSSISASASRSQPGKSSWSP